MRKRQVNAHLPQGRQTVSLKLVYDLQGLVDAFLDTRKLVFKGC